MAQAILQPDDQLHSRTLVTDNLTATYSSTLSLIYRVGPTNSKILRVLRHFAVFHLHLVETGKVFIIITGRHVVAQTPINLSSIDWRNPRQSNGYWRTPHSEVPLYQFLRLYTSPLWSTILDRDIDFPFHILTTSLIPAASCLIHCSALLLFPVSFTP